MGHPVLALWRAVLVRLRDDAAGLPPRPPAPVKANSIRDARAWLRTPSCGHVCDLADGDPNAVLRCALATLGPAGRNRKRRWAGAADDEGRAARIRPAHTRRAAVMAFCQVLRSSYPPGQEVRL